MNLKNFGKSSKIKKIHKFEVDRYSLIPKEADLALICDGSNLFMRNASIPTMATLTNGQGQKTGALFGSLKSIVSEIKHWHPKYVYFVVDRNGSRRKKELHEGYKANRPHGIRVQGPGSDESIEDAQARAEQEARQRQLQVLEEVLPELGICFCYVSGVEADDIIGSLVHIHEYSVIVSTDTDFIQLHNGVTTFVYNPLTKKLRDVNEFGVIGPAYAVLKSVVGDPTDNINGLDRVGWKTLIKWCENTYPDTLESFKELVDSRKDSNPLAKKIDDNWDLVKRNYKLIALDHSTIDFNPQMLLQVRSWRNKPVDVNIMKAIAILKKEDIDVRFLMDMMGVLQGLKR